MPFERSKLEEIAGLLADPESERKSVSKRRVAEEAVERLTDQEKMLLRNLAEGMSLRDISREQDVDLMFLEQRRRQVFQKIGAETTSDAVRIAIYAGLS